MKPSPIMRSATSKSLLSKCTVAVVLGIATSSSAAQGKKNIDSDAIEAVCKVSENETIKILNYLSIVLKSKPLSMETIRSAYVDLYRIESKEYRDRGARIGINPRMVEVFNEGLSDSFKFGLCQKLQRPTADDRTIAGERYLYCRQSLIEKSDKNPPPCF